jgi:hypothetical protein
VNAGIGGMGELWAGGSRSSKIPSRESRWPPRPPASWPTPSTEASAALRPSSLGRLSPWAEGVPADDHFAVRSPFSPRIGRRRALRGPVVGLEGCSHGPRAVDGRRERLIEDARVDPVPGGGDLGG